MNERIYYRIKISMIGLCVVILLLLGIELYLGVEQSTNGVRLGLLQEEIRIVYKENMLLREQVEQAEAFMTIEQKAKAMGFTQTATSY